MAKQTPPQLAHPLQVPLVADSVDSPVVQYGGALTAVHFTTEDGRWGRITFERLDSIKVSRGEHEPFPYAPDEPDGFDWVTTISNSAWLRERYEYEKEHYGSAYNFCGNVDEILDEFSHYVFSFHDEFVEAIAAGIWFESADAMLAEGVLDSSHPLNGLANVEPVERFEGSGIVCFVRRNPLSLDAIERAAGLCSQVVLEVGAVLDGRSSTSWSVTRRVRNGKGKSFLRGYFGNAVETYDGIPSLSEIRPRIDQWLAEVRERRRQMGKE
jgi:hypothetical protein